MLARVTAGDAAAALDEYARFQRRLLEELGTSPAPETERLHTAILREEPPGSWPRQAPQRVERHAGSNSGEQPVVGRARERETLVAALERAAGGQGGGVVLVGEPGMGKTRLLRAAVDMVGERFHVLQASGREREQHLPFQLIAEAIRSLDNRG